MLRNLSIRNKLILALLLVSLLPLAVVVYLSMSKSSDMLYGAVTDKFHAAHEAKAAHLSDYLHRVRTTLMILKDDPHIHEALNAMNKVFEENGNTVATPAWEELAKRYDPRFRRIQEENGWYDLFLIHTDGDIVYTAVRESDLGMVIPESNLKDTSMGRAFAAMQKAGKDGAVLADYQPYPPSNNEPAAFMMTALTGPDGKVSGFVALQLPSDQINTIVQQRAGLDETCESYLVGRLDGATSLRSDRVVKEGAIGEAKSDKFIDLALEGKSGFDVKIGSTGEKEVLYYGPVQVEGVNWAMITTEPEQDAVAAVTRLRNAMLTIVLAAAAIVAAIAFFLAGGIVRPIRRTVVMLKDIAEGDADLTQRLSADSRDELGEMATWFNLFMDRLQALIRDIAGNAVTLGESSGNLNQVAKTLSSGAEGVSERSGGVAAAAEEMSANMSSVAAASEQASTNVNMVAAATEEMTATVEEIAQNSETARSITENAVRQSGNASSRVNELGQAAAEISKVTEVITEISEQTNLLALNATIEAARAGEAGKGFAVVANEIKELAKQTAEATQQIKSQIEGIQQSTGATVGEINEISAIIGNVSEIVATIATAVEEQAVSSREIANNIAQAGQGIEEVNQNVSQTSAVSSSISADIAEVNHSVNDINTASSQVASQADELSGLAETLRRLVGQFKTE